MAARDDRVDSFSVLRKLSEAGLTSEQIRGLGKFKKKEDQKSSTRSHEMMQAQNRSAAASRRLKDPKKMGPFPNQDVDRALKHGAEMMLGPGTAERVGHFLTHIGGNSVSGKEASDNLYRAAIGRRRAGQTKRKLSERSDSIWGK